MEFRILGFLAAWAGKVASLEEISFAVQDGDVDAFH
jgi:hypothetical protein